MALNVGCSEKNHSYKTLNGLALLCFWRSTRVFRFPFGIMVYVACAMAQEPAGVDPGFNVGSGVVGGGVNTIAVQEDGKLLIGGSFTNYQGIIRNRIARLNLDGALDPSFNPGKGANDAVNAVAIQSDGLVYIGGNFNLFNGVARSGIARLNPDGSLDTTFDAALGPNSVVNSMVMQIEGKVLFGGVLYRPAEGDTRAILRFNPDGSVDPSFACSAYSTLNTLALALQSDGKVLRAPQSGTLLHYNIDGSWDEGFLNREMGVTGTPSSLPAGFYALAVQPDGKILAAGSFTELNQIDAKWVGRFNPDGTVDTSFTVTEGPNDTVCTLALQPDGKVLIGGYFTAIGSRPFQHLARLNSDGSLDLSFKPQPGTDGIVQSLILQKDGKVVVGGTFSRLNDQPSPGIGRLQGGNPLAGAPQVTTPPQNQTVIAGMGVLMICEAYGFPVPSMQWQFNDVNLPGATNDSLQLDNFQVSRSGRYSVVLSNYLGSVTSAPAILTVLPVSTAPEIVDSLSLKSQFPNLTDIMNLRSFPKAMALQRDGGIILAIKSLNHWSPDSIFRLKPDGILDGSFTNGLGQSYSLGWPVTMALDSQERILIAGQIGLGLFHFDEVTNVLLRLDTNGMVDPSFSIGKGVDQPIEAIAIQKDDKILVGGKFTNYNLIPQRTLARVLPDGSLDPSFSSGQGLAVKWASSQQMVHAIRLQSDNKILVGGHFTSYDNQPYDGLVRLHPNGSPDASFKVQLTPPDIGEILLQPDGKVLIAGGFTVVNGKSRNGIARLESSGALDPTFNPCGRIYYGSLALQSDGKIVVGGRLFPLDSSPSRSLVVRLDPDGNVDILFGASTAFDGAIVSLLLQADGKVLIGGGFGNLNGVECYGVARLNVDIPCPVSLLCPTRMQNRFDCWTLTRSGHRYVFECRDSLTAGEWTPLHDTQGDDTVKTFQDSNNTAPQRFYRVRVE